MILAPALLAAAAVAAPDAAIRAAAEKIAPKVVAVRRDLHAHPELSNREERTGHLVAERLRDLGLEVRYPVARTGVVAVLRGGRPGRVVALRADMDALPIAERNDVPYRSTAEGVMHACGHDAHTAILLGAAEVLQSLRATLPGTVVFLFQPAEEGAPVGEKGGAPLMVEEGALDQPKVEAVFGLHVGGWAETGQAGWTDGPIFASSDTFTIEVAGQTVHGAEPWKGIDPIPVAAEIVQALQLVVTRQVDGRQPRVLTIGKIQGGDALQHHRRPRHDGRDDEDPRRFRARAHQGADGPHRRARRRGPRHDRDAALPRRGQPSDGERRGPRRDRRRRCSGACSARAR